MTLYDNMRETAMLLGQAGLLDHPQLLGWSFNIRCPFCRVGSVVFSGRTPTASAPCSMCRRVLDLRALAAAIQRADDRRFKALERVVRQNRAVYVDGAKRR